MNQLDLYLISNHFCEMSFVQTLYHKKFVHAANHKISCIFHEISLTLHSHILLQIVKYHNFSPYVFPEISWIYHKDILTIYDKSFFLMIIHYISWYRKIFKQKAIFCGEFLKPVYVNIHSKIIKNKIEDKTKVNPWNFIITFYKEWSINVEYSKINDLFKIYDIGYGWNIAWNIFFD